MSFEYVVNGEVMDPQGGEFETLVSIWLDDIRLPGAYRAEESGAGIHEKYRVERESESGGADTVNEPPASRLIIEAYVREETFERLEDMRHRTTPFEVMIGPFAYDEMGMRNLEAITRADEQNAIQVNIQLQAYREHTVQSRNLLDGGSGSVPEVGTGERPSAAWVDENGDGYDDITGRIIPETETIPVANGQQWQEEVRSDEAFGRTIFDNAGPESRPQVEATGSNWSVQDVGFRGPSGGSSHENGWTNMNLENTGGSSLVSNIYMGDGAPSGRGTGIWVDPSSRGIITFEYLHIAGMADNGVYASPPKGNATINIYDSFSYNNGISNYRVGLGEIVDSVSFHDGGGHGTWGGRGVWGRTPGPVNVRNCEIVSRAGTEAVWSGADVDGPSVVNLENCGIEGGFTTKQGGVINESGTREGDPSAFNYRIPGSALDAAAGLTPPRPPSGL